ncbi:MAG: cytochrome c biogenesis protein ResB [Blastocatellia bacterium]|nr:cytochrome c biogenesis protein ResB [Blastocatellia bacterium]
MQSSQELPAQASTAEPAAETAPETEKPGASAGRKGAGINGLIDRFLNLISSVPFGIVLLVLLIVACMIGMLIQQQELESFPGYFAELTPSEKRVYGTLGFFDIYHVWYFNLLLLLLSLNIILASIDHFPAAWSFIAKKKLTASPTFAMAQKFKEKVELPQHDRKQLADRAAAAARAVGFKARVTEEETRTTIFAERGVWNRLGAYVVHIGLLTIFFGGFMTSRGFTGMMQVTPKQTSDRMIRNTFDIDLVNSQHAVRQQEMALPFKIVGVDIQHKPINKAGGIDTSNTLDWLTRIRIDDPETGRKTDALVHMNTPYDYRGYRFFQASYNPMGSARTIKLAVTPTGGGATQEISLERSGETPLSDGTRLKYVEFNPHFIFTRDGQVDFGSTEYENPAAHIAYVTPDGKQGDLWAFNQSFLGEISNAPFVRTNFLDGKPFQMVLTDFEKVSLAHTLSVQYDPGARIVYVGFTILCLTLLGVFFFSHQRLWIVVEDGKVHMGGDSNRNRLGFEDRARKLAALIREPAAAK